MTIRRTVIGLITAFTMGGLVSQAHAEENLRIGVEAAYPPFSMKTENGELTGFDIEITWALCAQMGRTCELVEQDWDGMIPALKARKYDAIIASMGITEDRKRQVNFTERYYYSAAALIAPADTKVEASEAGTSGISIGVQRATAHECYHENHFSKAELKQYQTTEEAYLDLQAQRVDALLVDTLPALDWLKANDKEGKYKLVVDDLYDESCFGEGIGIAIRKADDDLRLSFNKAIKELRANGKYQTINAKYFDVDIYGPDN